MKNKNKEDNTEKIKPWMLILVILTGGIIGGVIALIIEVVMFRKLVKSANIRFLMMLPISILIGVVIYLNFII